jgi:beta-N-acetylhexosaminidase
MGAAYIKGIQDSRCIAVGKHFPGHGDTDRDSHLTLPVIHYDMNRLSRIEMVPFKKAIGAGVDGIMTAHIAYPEILGASDPATVSKKFLTDILRNEFRFDGLVITDDMEMHAISRRQEMGEAAVRSIVAGADIILISSYKGSIPAIINAITKAVREKRVTEERINASVERIIEAKIRYGILSYEEGTCRPGKYALTEKDKKAFKDSGSVNESLSRKGILYFGNEELIRPETGTIRIFITQNGILRKELSRNVNNIILTALGELGSYVPAKDKKTVAYLHVVQPDIEYIKSVAGYCKIKGIDVILVSSGNPFPITVSGIVRAGLLSFSNTEESIRQLGRCLNGEFRPRTGGSLLLGIENRKL